MMDTGTRRRVQDVPVTAEVFELWKQFSDEALLAASDRRGERVKRALAVLKRRPELLGLLIEGLLDRLEKAGTTFEHPLRPLREYFTALIERMLMRLDLAQLQGLQRAIERLGQEKIDGFVFPLIVRTAKAKA